MPNRLLYQLRHADVLRVGTRGLEPHSQDFQSCAYTMSAKCPLAEAERFELSEPFERLGPLAEGWFRPLTHASLLLPHMGSPNRCTGELFEVDAAKLESRDAAYLRT